MQLASFRSCLVLDAIALRNSMNHILQQLLEDASVWKVFHVHTNHVQWLGSNFHLAVGPPIYDTAMVQQELDGIQPPQAIVHGSLQMLCQQHLGLLLADALPAINAKVLLPLWHVQMACMVRRALR